MSTDDPFVTAIRSNWLDRTTRLAYADWLEDRADPRAELVRVCEGMRDVPVWSDRYWELKARRNELWTRVPLEWLEATGYDGSYYDPLFRDGVPDDPLARWRLIREFTERWHGIAVPDVGGQRDAVQSLEQELKLVFPPSVREFVAFVHDLDNYGWSDNISAVSLFHCARGDLVRLTAHPALGLIDYSLGGRLGVFLEDLAHPDPRAFEFGTHWSKPPRLQAVTVSLAAFRNLFIELPNAGSMSTVFDNPPPNTDELLAKLATDFPIHARFDDNDVFESDELLVVVGVSDEGAANTPRRNVEAFVRRPIPFGAVPDYLFGGENRNVSSSGMLGSEWFRRRQEEAQHPGWRPPGWVSARVWERIRAAESDAPLRNEEPLVREPGDGNESPF